MTRKNLERLNKIVGEFDYENLESIDFESIIDIYEERLEKTKGNVEEKRYELEESVWEIANDNINIYDDDLEKEAKAKIKAYIEFENTTGVKAKNASDLLRKGEFQIIDNVLTRYHDRRMKELEDELKNTRKR